MTESPSYDLISPTAKAVAWLRARSGIRYAADIAKVISAQEAVLNMVGGEANAAAMGQTFTAWAELRFQSITAALQERNVLELAAGFSPRGLIFTDAYPDSHYLSTGLESDHNLRMNVLTSVGQGSRKNLWYRIVDATSREEVVSCASFFKSSGEVAVVLEGLLVYLSHAEKLQVARNIRELLQLTGGTWYTSDIHTVSESARVAALSSTYLGRIEEKVDRNYTRSAFTDLDEAEELVTMAGLRVSRYDQTAFVPLEELVSPIPDLPIEEMLRDQHLWVMKPV